MSIPTRRWENAFKVNFSHYPFLPPQEDVGRIVATLIPPGILVLRIHFCPIKRAAFVQMHSQAAAQRIVDEHNGRRGAVINGLVYEFQLELVRKETSVYVLDLPYYITNMELRAEMVQFGEVKSIHELRWGHDSPVAGTLMGIREVRMVLERPIRHFVTVQGEVTGLQVADQPAIYPQCNRQSQPRANVQRQCSAAASTIAQLEPQAGPSSRAGRPLPTELPRAPPPLLSPIPPLTPLLQAIGEGAERSVANCPTTPHPAVASRGVGRPSRTSLEVELASLRLLLLSRATSSPASVSGASNAQAAAKRKPPENVDQGAEGSQGPKRSCDGNGERPA